MADRKGDSSMPQEPCSRGRRINRASCATRPGAPAVAAGFPPDKLPRTRTPAPLRSGTLGRLLHVALKAIRTVAVPGSKIRMGLCRDVARGAIVSILNRMGDHRRCDFVEPRSFRRPPKRFKQIRLKHRLREAVNVALPAVTPRRMRSSRSHPLPIVEASRLVTR